MNPNQFDDLDAALRRAISRGAYGEAQDHVTGLREAIEGALRDGAPGGDVERLVGRANDLLRWALQATRAGRAHRRLQLCALDSVSRYHGSSASPPTRRFEA
jgi:hypothetical protein